MPEAVAARARRRSLVIVLSDFIGTGEWERPRLRGPTGTTCWRCGSWMRRMMRCPRSAWSSSRASRPASSFRSIQRPAVPVPIPERGGRAGRVTRSRAATCPGSAAPGEYAGRNGRHPARRRAQQPATAGVTLSAPLLLVVAGLVICVVLFGRRRAAALTAAGISIPSRRGRQLGAGDPGRSLRTRRRRARSGCLPAGRTADGHGHPGDGHVSNSMSATDGGPERRPACRHRRGRHRGRGRRHGRRVLAAHRVRRRQPDHHRADHRPVPTTRLRRLRK